MTPQSILLGAGAGLISAIVFISANTGPGLSRVALYLLTPFSLYLAGLGLGFMPALAAACSGALVLLALTESPAVAAVYAISEAAPAVALTRLALLRRGADETAPWYPVGRLLVVAALFSSLAAIFVLMRSGSTIETLVEALKPAIEEVAKSMQLPDGTPMGGAEIAAFAKGVAPLIPGMLAITIMLAALFSLWLSGRVTLAAGRLARPWPDLSRMELPLGSALVLAAATGLGFAGGEIGLVASCISGAFRFAFALLGLSVLHYVTRPSPWRSFILAALYIALFVLSQPTLLVLTLIGLAETVFRYRALKRRDAPPPS